MQELILHVVIFIKSRLTDRQSDRLADRKIARQMGK